MGCQSHPDSTSFALICGCIIRGELPALCAWREKPSHPSDSGWMIECGVRDHNVYNKDAKIVCTSCAAEMFTRIGPFLDRPWPCEFRRTECPSGMVNPVQTRQLGDPHRFRPIGAPARNHG